MHNEEDNWVSIGEAAIHVMDKLVDKMVLREKSECGQITEDEFHRLVRYAQEEACISDGESA